MPSCTFEEHYCRQNVQLKKVRLKKKINAAVLGLIMIEFSQQVLIKELHEKLRISDVADSALKFLWLKSHLYEI